MLIESLPAFTYTHLIIEFSISIVILKRIRPRFIAETGFTKIRLECYNFGKVRKHITVNYVHLFGRGNRISTPTQVSRNDKVPL